MSILKFSWNEVLSRLLAFASSSIYWQATNKRFNGPSNVIGEICLIVYIDGWDCWIIDICLYGKRKEEKNRLSIGWVIGVKQEKKLAFDEELKEFTKFERNNLINMGVCGASKAGSNLVFFDKEGCIIVYNLKKSDYQ